MRYISTRGAWANDPQPFRAILLEGLAPDGGLAVPEHYPRFSAAEFEALDVASQHLPRGNACAALHITPHKNLAQVRRLHPAAVEAVSADHRGHFAPGVVSCAPNHRRGHASRTIG